MSLNATDEQRELRSTVSRFLSEQSPLPRVRELAFTAPAFDDALWDRMAKEIGVQSLGVPERHGGMGLGYQDLGYTFEELGATLACPQLLATVGLALPLLVASDDEDAAARYLPGIASGEVRPAVAWMSATSGWQRPGSVAATGDGDVWRVDGTAAYVLGAEAATVLLVVAGTSEGPTVIAVDAGDDAVRVEWHEGFDQTRPLSTITFARAPGRRVSAAGAGTALLSTALDHARALLAAEAVGVAQRCLDMSVEYAMQRHQFGRPIGSFQAIKHKCAETFVRLEAARSAARYACWAADGSHAELPATAVLAKAAATEAAFRAAADMVQIHGGIGVTWEHDAHLYLKRAEAMRLLLGTTGEHRRLLADRIGL